MFNLLLFSQAKQANNNSNVIGLWWRLDEIRPLKGIVWHLALNIIQSLAIIIILTVMLAFLLLLPHPFLFLPPPASNSNIKNITNGIYSLQWPMSLERVTESRYIEPNPSQYIMNWHSLFPWQITFRFLQFRKLLHFFLYFNSTASLQLYRFFFQ